MQIKDVEKLKAWLLTKLEPLCDADPAALAKYVVALLRKEKPKSALRELCVDQLEVFLAKETVLFVDRLFKGLDSESYLTGRGSRTPSPEATPPNSGSQAATKPPPTRQGPPVPGGNKSESTAATASCPGGQSSSTSERGSGGGSGGGGGGGGGEKGRVGGGGGGGGAGKRHSEDPRSREVDDEDRDFRRSRARGGRGGDRPARGMRGGVTVSREPDSSTGGCRRGAESGVKGHSSTSVSTSGEMRGKRRRGEGEGVSGVSSTGGSRQGEGGVARRIVREKGRPYIDGRQGRRTWPHRSRSRSSSSDSSSSTTSSHDHSRKRTRQEWNERGSSSRGDLGGSSEGTKTQGGEEGGGEETTQGSEGKRKRCKDYDGKGFCMLGDQCPFDHGVDPVVIGNNIPHTYPPPPSMVGIPSLTLTKPDLANYLVPPATHPGRASPTESTTDGYNPEEPGLTATTTSPTSFLPGPLLNPGPLLPRPFPHPHPPHIQGVPTLPPLPPVGAFPPPPPLPPPITSASHQFPPPPRPHSHWPRPPQQPFSFPRQPSDTLIVRKIPRESNSITKLSSHFEKFGTIVNLTVWYGGDPEGALVQFATPFEARKAHDSAEAVLNNRFIKIYYLRRDTYPPPQQPREQQIEIQSVAPQQGSGDHTPSLTHHPVQPPKITSPVPRSHTQSHTPYSTHHTLPQNRATSAHTYVSSTTKTSVSHSVVPHHVTDGGDGSGQRKRKVPDTAESKEMAKKRQELQRKTGELLHKQIDQQKVLISKLEKGGKQVSAEERKKIIKTIKTLSGHIEKLKNMASEAMEARLKSKQAPPSPTSPTPHSPSLTEKAQALRQEAHQLGLIPSPSQTTPTPGSYVTGSHVTGSAPRGGQQGPDLRAVLNKKQKRLLVLNAENREQLTAHFDTFGGLVSVEVDPENCKNLIFSFRNPYLAQKAAKHSSFNGKPLIMKWYSPKVPAPYSHPHQPPHVTPSLLQPAPQPLSLPLFFSSNADPTSKSPEVTTPTIATPTLTKLDPGALHLVEDDEDEEERSWRR